MNDPVEHFCHAIRESFPGAEIVYTRGGCWEFFKVLRAVWPDAEPYYRDGHIFTRIGDGFYDVNGKRPLGGNGLSRMSKPELRGAHRWRDRRLVGLDAIIAVYSGLEVRVDYDASL